MSDLSAFIDIYCERTAPGFLNEPFNALSNAAFLIAAWWNFTQIDPKHRVSMASGLCLLAALIGLGSFAFHTRPSLLTQWVDVIPIWLFVCGYATAAIYVATGRNLVKTVVIGVLGVAALVFLFLITGELVTAKPPGDKPSAVNGSLQYLPAVIALLVFSVLATVRSHPARTRLWIATGLFLLALFFRTIDLTVCRELPIGTHVLWHLLNGVMIAVLLRGFIQSSGVARTP